MVRVTNSRIEKIAKSQPLSQSFVIATQHITLLFCLLLGKVFQNDTVQDQKVD